MLPNGFTSPAGNSTQCILHTAFVPRFVASYYHPICLTVRSVSQIKKNSLVTQRCLPEFDIAFNLHFSIPNKDPGIIFMSPPY